ncbi:hypothetical protein OS242_20285 [Tumebacillus sp. DT12]|uniref:Uncharacterized protein n=1 Tax=Tumebacillus lacus TaxID=2995335 RepID=A0ABT3X5S0_9BACL|nr:hypothetical protein [Tumebacillus lacus]MCX7572251.1 hypothetical protein [Tumebacillus lacus]
MTHEVVLKSFYARLKGVAADSMIRIVELAREHGVSYRYLSDLLRNEGLQTYWIGGKAFVCRQEAVSALHRAS